MMMSSGGMLLNMIFWILIVGIVIYAFISILTKPLEKKVDPSLQILKERFARGEITEEEFEQKSAVLREK
jgi:putative membrane protein